MAVIYMRHFLHGTKVAICEEEARYDEKHGWTRYNPEEIKLPEKVVSIESVNAMETSRRRKSTG